MPDRIDYEALAAMIEGGAEPPDGADDLGEWAERMRAEAASQIRALGRELDAAGADLADWRDADSPRRQSLLEETVMAVGDGMRSEVELREAQLDAAEAARAAALRRAEEAEREVALMHERTIEELAVYEGLERHPCDCSICERVRAKEAQ